MFHGAVLAHGAVQEGRTPVHEMTDAVYGVDLILIFIPVGITVTRDI